MDEHAQGSVGVTPSTRPSASTQQVMETALFDANVQKTRSTVTRPLQRVMKAAL